MSNERFVVSALVDFADDCGNIVFTPTLIENLVERLQWMGATRVYWNFYQPGMWKFFGVGREAPRETIKNLGEPVAVGARAAHKRGMEFYATIKPYETGASHANPRHSPRMLENPGLPGIGGDYTLFCGIALGHAAPDAPINTTRTARAGVDEFARFEGF